jgi:uncharacterized peroxidase-related enzyme
MAFIETTPEDRAEGQTAEHYAATRDAMGYVPNYAAAFSARPDVYAAWMRLNGAIKSNMDLRRYELATVAAARRLRSSYCALAHGTVLSDRFLGPDTLREVVIDHHGAGLDEVDVAVMDLADKVAADASAITLQDIDALRALGLSDADILDVVLAAAARCFFSKTLDGLGVQPDAKFSELDPELREALTVGRAIAEQ